MDYLYYLSETIGWIQFLAWSISFWPQAVINYRRGCVEGFSLEFIVLNTMGFGAQSIHENPDSGKVYIQDILFAVHAFILNNQQLQQALTYPRKNDKSINKYILILIIIILAQFSITILNILTKFTTLDMFTFIRTLSTIKLMISFFKQIPQVVLNISRKSTVGWSIENILLDFTGGTFNQLQLQIDSIRDGYWNYFLNPDFNLTKLGLSFISIFFDLIFITQHQCIYTERKDYDIEEIDNHEKKFLRENQSV